MEKLNRRNFLRSTLLGTGGALVAAPAFAGGTLKRNGRGIITRTLGKTGLEIPVVSMGVMRADNPGLVRAALEAGMIHFDTAHGYQGGGNEEMLGKVLKEVERDKVVVTTKVSPLERDRRTGDVGAGSTKGDFLNKLDISLERLQMDYVDILCQHGAGSAQAVQFEPMLDALQAAKRQGKARFIGYSCHSQEPEVIRAAAEVGIVDVIVVGNNFKHDRCAEIRAAMAEAADKGMGFIGMKAMAGGFLDRERQKPVSPRAALKWILQDPNLTTCIPGFTTFEHVESAASVISDLTLTEEELDHIEMARLEAGLFCNQCRQCMDQCPRGLNIPAAMRSYMYAYGYGETMKARETLLEYKVENDPCDGCTHCRVNCRKGFPVAERLADVTRLLDVPADFLT